MKTNTKSEFVQISIEKEKKKGVTESMYQKVVVMLLLIMSLLLFNINGFTQNNSIYTICPGDSILLWSEAVDPNCTSPRSVSWSTEGLNVNPFFTQYNSDGYLYINGDPFSTIWVTPTQNTSYFAYSPSFTCSAPNDFNFCGTGLYTPGQPIGPQGPAGPQPAPTPSIITEIVVEVIDCATSPVSAEGCEVPFTGEMFFESCNGSLFFFLEMGNGSIFDPYFADNIDFVPYEGQIVNFDYEIADFASPCGADIEAITITCIEEAAESVAVGDDMGVTEVIVPSIETSGFQTISANVTNFGSTVVSSGTINWEVNSEATQSYSFSNLSIYPGVTYTFNLGTYYVDVNENYIFRVFTENPNAVGSFDARPENDMNGASYIGNPNADNIIYLCKGETASLTPISYAPTGDCYGGCTPGTSDCVECHNVIFPDRFTNCQMDCGSYGVTPDFSFHYALDSYCFNIFDPNAVNCFSDATEYFIVVEDCSGPDNTVGDCGFTNTGTMVFEDCGESIFYYIQQSDGSLVDPYFGFGVDFDYYDGQVVAYDSYVASFGSACESGPEAITVTCISEVDVNSNSDAGIVHIVQPFYVPDGESEIIVLLENFGTDSLYSANVNITINGEALPVHEFVADGVSQNPVAPGGNTYVVIDPEVFLPIDYEIRAWTSSPNDLPDPDPTNDLVVSNLVPGFVPLDTLDWGTYTIPFGDELGLSLTIPAMQPGCTINSDPVITPNTDVTYVDNHFSFSPSVNTDYTIVYPGTCQDYVYTVSVEIEGACSYANTGTIFFDNCVGEVYFFIEMDDGTLLDPYYAEGVVFNHYDGQAVEFDYVPADFTTPCPGKTAVYLTCIREIPVECTYAESGNIFFADCDDGTPYFFIEMESGAVLDHVYAPGLNFTHYDGQAVEFDFQLAVIPSLCSGAVAVTITCIRSADFRLDVDVLLEGAYDEVTNEMSTDIAQLAEFPTTQPYNQAPWFYAGTESLGTVDLNDVVDWILVELRTGTPDLINVNTTVEATQAAILLKDGSIVSASTGNVLSFGDLEEGESYYIAIRHRNHLDMISSASVTASTAAVMTYDFTASNDAAFGPEQQKNVGNRSCMFSGEFNGDGVIQTSDYDTWIADPALVNVYQNTDANLDGIVQSTDFDKWFLNKAKVGMVEIRYE